MGIMYKLVLRGERVSLLAGAIQCLLCQSITRISLTGKSNQMAENVFNLPQNLVKGANYFYLLL